MVGALSYPLRRRVPRPPRLLLRLPVGPDPTYVVGTFEAASLFENKCQSPRTGVDSEGNAFPDQAGTLVKENFWLRSWTNENLFVEYGSTRSGSFDIQ